MIAVALVVAVAGRVAVHWWWFVNVPVVRAFFGKQIARGRDRLTKLAGVLPESPFGTLVSTLVSAAVATAPDRTIAEVQAELTEAAGPAERRFLDSMRIQMMVDGALVAAGVVAAAWFAAGTAAPAWWSWALIGTALAAEGFVLWREIGVVRQTPAALTQLVSDLARGVTSPAGGVTDPALPAVAEPAAAATEPSPYRDTEAASAKRVVRKPAPRRCPWCGHGEFAQGEMVALRAVAFNNVDRSSDLPRHACHAIVCLGCGRLEWFVQDPPALFGEGETEARRPERMLRVRAVDPDDEKPGRSE